MIDRRALFKLGLGALAHACSTSSTESTARLKARPWRTGNPACPDRQDCLSPIDLGLKRPALLYVPEKPSGAFALMLHGANGRPDRLLSRIQPQADEFGVTLLAPKSEDLTWDAVYGSFGPDIAFIDDALRAAFAACAIDRKHLAVSGFSDGATYAIALGRANGDLFTHVLAFSAGFILPVETYGAPRVFLSHGTQDDIIPIDSGGRRIARELRRENLSVKFREFDGEHTLPPDVAREAFEWFKR